MDNIARWLRRCGAAIKSAIKPAARGNGIKSIVFIMLAFYVFGINGMARALLNAFQQRRSGAFQRALAS